MENAAYIYGRKQSLNSKAQNSTVLPVTGSREGPVLMGLRQAASKGKRQEGRAHIAASDLSIHIRSCPSIGVEYVDGEEPSMKPQEREARSNGNGTEIMGMPFLVCCGCNVSSMKYNLCSSKVEWELKRHL